MTMENALYLQSKSNYRHSTTMKMIKLGTCIEIHLRCVLLSVMLLNSINLLSNIQFNSMYNTTLLNSTYITGITQDSKGFMWFATLDGIICYDGYHERKYFAPDKESLFDGFGEVITDGSGNLWAKNYNNTYLYSIKDDKLTLEGNKFLRDLGMTALTNDLFVDQEGNLWGMDGNELQYYDYQNNPHLTKIKASISQLVGVSARGHFKVCLFSDGQLMSLNASNRKLSLVTKLSTEPKPLSSNTVHMYIDCRSRLWIYYPEYSTDIDCIDLITNRKEDTSALKALFRNDFVKSMAEDSNGNLWLATNSMGLVVHNIMNSNNTLYTKNNDDICSLPSNHVNFLYYKNGVMWIGTNKRAVYAETEIPHHELYILPEPESVTTMIKNQHDLWVGFDGMGLRKYMPDGSSRSFTTSNSSLPSNTIISACLDRQSRLWFCSFGKGVFYYDGSRFVTPPEITSKKDLAYAKGCVFDSKNKMWIATFSNGLYCLSDNGMKSFTISNSEIGTNSLTSIAYNEQNLHIYVGTALGLIAIDSKSFKVNKVPLTTAGKLSVDSIANHYVYSIHSDKHGNTWVGTKEGIYLIGQNDKTIAYLSVNDGLVSPSARSIISDLKGNLWVGSINGYSYIMVDKKGQPIQVTPFEMEINSRKVNFEQNSTCCDEDGFILLGSEGFYVKIDPSLLPMENKEINTIFTQLSVGGKFRQALHSTRDVVLNYNDENVTFEVSGLNYTNTKKQRFRYRLSDDGDWIEMDGNKINFSQLQPGKYVIEVQARQPNGSYGKTSTINLRVTPPWWLTVIAKIFYVILACGGLLLIIYYYKQKSKKEIAVQSEALRNQYQKDIHESQEQMLTELIDNPLLKQVSEAISAHLSETDYSVEQLSKEIGLTRSGLYRKLVSITGKTPLEIIHIMRVKQGKILIDNGETSISQAAYNVGLSPKQFARHFKEIYGMLPSDYMRSS